MIRPFPELENIHAIPIELPGFEDLKTANIYAVGRGPFTLIDTGPKYPGLLEQLNYELRQAGYRLGDVERIILTHGHIDHFGMTYSIREAAGRDVACYIHPEDAWKISSANTSQDLWDHEAYEVMALAGMPLAEIEGIRERFSFFKDLCDPINNPCLMEDGDEFFGNAYHLTVIHTPGHTPGSVSLYESRSRVLFSGDHVIKHITPNPLIEMRRTDLRDPDYQSLRAFKKSLDKLQSFDIQYVFPGHGEYIEDVADVIRTYSVHHRQRMELVWQALNNKSRPLFHLIGDVFENVPEGDAFLAVSEIYVHLEMLINEGRAELADPGPPALYRALP
ncbi:MAG: MBL fold metallo-hydrolase [Deltaproteobacteria bacterium]|nr:MBL fold metallo-hydrolase [Deltaproteobacteria bacterium]